MYNWNEKEDIFLDKIKDAKISLYNNNDYHFLANCVSDIFKNLHLTPTIQDSIDNLLFLVDKTLIEISFFRIEIRAGLLQHLQNLLTTESPQAAFTEPYYETTEEEDIIGVLENKITERFGHLPKYKRLHRLILATKVLED